LTGKADNILPLSRECELSNRMEVAWSDQSRSALPKRWQINDQKQVTPREGFWLPLLEKELFRAKK